MRSWRIKRINCLLETAGAQYIEPLHFWELGNLQAFKLVSSGMPIENNTMMSLPKMSLSEKRIDKMDWWC
jgi:hypothetical protein